jgi:hypothetical protein
MQIFYILAETAWLLIFCWLVTTRMKVKSKGRYWLAIDHVTCRNPVGVTWPAEARTRPTRAQFDRKSILKVKSKKNYSNEQSAKFGSCVNVKANENRENQVTADKTGLSRQPLPNAWSGAIALSLLDCTARDVSQLNGGVARQINQNSRQRSRRFPRSMGAVPNRRKGHIRLQRVWEAENKVQNKTQINQPSNSRNYSFSFRKINAEETNWRQVPPVGLGFKLTCWNKRWAHYFSRQLEIRNDCSQRVNSSLHWTCVPWIFKNYFNFRPLIICT